MHVPTHCLSFKSCHSSGSQVQNFLQNKKQVFTDTTCISHSVYRSRFFFLTSTTITQYITDILYIYMRLHVWKAHACSSCVMYHVKWSKYNSNTSLYLLKKNHCLYLHYCMKWWCGKLCRISHLCSKCWCWKSYSSKLPRQIPYVLWSFPCHVFVFQTLLQLY